MSVTKVAGYIKYVSYKAYLVLRPHIVSFYEATSRCYLDSAYPAACCIERLSYVAVFYVHVLLVLYLLNYFHCQRSSTGLSAVLLSLAVVSVAHRLTY